MVNDAHGNPITQERRQFTSEVAQEVLAHYLDGYRISTYRPSELETTALLRTVSLPRPVIEWPVRTFSSKSIERGVRNALNPAKSPDLSDDQRCRVAMASWHNDAGFMSYEDCEAVVRLSFAERRALKGVVTG